MSSTQEVRQELYHVRKQARLERFRLAGRDVERVLELETMLRDRIRKATELFLEVTKPEVKDSAARLAKLSRTKFNRASWSLPVLPPKGPPGQFVEVFDPLGRRMTQVGSVDFWEPFTELEACINGRTEIQADPPEAASVCRASHVEACCGNGYAVATGEMGITHSCSVRVMHDFQFVAPQENTFGFWPEFSVNGNAAVTGQALAAVRIHVATASTSKQATVFYESGDYSGVAWASHYTANPPRVKRSLGAGETADVTVACELYVEAHELASAILDFDADENHYLCSSVLRVDVLERTVPLVETPPLIMVLEEPVLREVRLPHPDLPPLFS